MGWAVGFFQVAAVDLDGTLTSRGRVSAEAVEAIDRARQTGLVVVLVTGRIGVELAAEFADIADHFDALVLENGAVAVTGGRTHRLAAPVDRVLDDALAERGVLVRRGPPNSASKASAAHTCWSRPVMGVVAQGNDLQ